VSVLVEAIDVRKSFETLEVLKGVSFQLKKGETLVIMGWQRIGQDRSAPSCRRAAPSRQWRHRPLRAAHRAPVGEALLPIRRRLGYVFQGAALFDSLTVEENVGFPCASTPICRKPRLASA
jgi:phospholipid/cholesterol/gamma-HCH transport system ATP-binding protein